VCDQQCWALLSIHHPNQHTSSKLNPPSAIDYSMTLNQNPLQTLPWGPLNPKPWELKRCWGPEPPSKRCRGPLSPPEQCLMLEGRGEVGAVPLKSEGLVAAAQSS